MEEHEKLFAWYRDHSVPLRFPMGGVTSSEPLKIRLAVNFYLFLQKTHLVGAFASVYCKGKEQD
ncbi:MAG: hypothetical protein ACOYJL_03825 [Tractidigestivibacter sp.]|uniref:hypothetical protein n=1 Tax=Tractidigestivibacter sp. TaxID=2847320 RepID=UPI003D89E605